MYWRGEHTFAVLHALGGDIGAYPPPKKTYYVDGAHGSDSNTGLGSWRNAKKTYQAGVTAATRADNRYRDVDLIIGPWEYDEQVVVSGVAQGDYNQSTWYGWKMGRLRIIAMGDKVILKNSGVDTGDTLLILRKKVELHGGTFRNYTDTSGAPPTSMDARVRLGNFAGVRWERTMYSITVGDVIGGGMYGCRVEGRSDARIGVDIDGAVSVDIVGCRITGWDIGVVVCGNNFGYTSDNLIKDCIFRDNSEADIVLGGGYTLIVEECKFIDDAISTYIQGATVNAGVQGRIGTPTDTAVVNCAFNAANVDGQLHTGVKYMGSKCQDY